MEPSLILLVVMNLFFQFWVFLRAQLCLLISMHVSFINSTIKQCLLVPGTGDTGCFHRTYKPRVEWTSHPSLNWELLGDRNWVCKGLGQGLAPKGTQQLVKLKLNTSDSEKTELEFKKRLNVSKGKRPGLSRRGFVVLKSGTEARDIHNPLVDWAYGVEIALPSSRTNLEV